MIMSKAIQDVLQERKRQIEKKGYTLEVDNAGDRGRLSTAGACYALRAGLVLDEPGTDTLTLKPPGVWPFPPEFWKPKSVREDLVRAIALQLAELELIDRDAFLVARAKDAETSTPVKKNVLEEVLPG